MMARPLLLWAAIAALFLAGCYSPRYDWESPVDEEWRTSEGLLVDPYWHEGDELLRYERIDLLVPAADPGDPPDRKTVGYVKWVRMEGEDQGHVVRLVEDRSHVLTGVILPSGKTLRYTESGYREAGDFGYSDKRQYMFAIKNILNVDGNIDTLPWDGTVEE